MASLSTPGDDALPAPVADAAIVTSATKVATYLQKNRSRNLVAAMSFRGNALGYEHGTLEGLAIVVGDSTTFTNGGEGDWRIGEPELVADIDLSKLSATMFKLSGLEDALKSDSVLKVIHDSRLPSVAMHAKYKVRPSPVFDTSLADVLFRQEDKDKRLARMHSSFHFQVFQSPALKNALGNCCRLNSFTEAIVEHGVVTAEVAKEHTIVQDAIALYRLFKKFEIAHRNSKALAWSELVNWSDRFVNYYEEPKKALPTGPDGKPIRVAKTGEGLAHVLYDNHNMLPLAVMPRRSAIGDGSQIQVGRLLTVDQHSRTCRGCQRKIGPCNDCFEPRSEYCYLCDILNWSFKYRKEGKEKQSIEDVVAAVNAAQDAAAEIRQEKEKRAEEKRAAEAQVEQQQGQPRRKKIRKEKRRK